MRFLLLTILLSLSFTALAKRTIPNRLLIQDTYENYYNNQMGFDKDQNLDLNARALNQSFVPERELSLGMNNPQALPDNIQLEKMWEGYNHMQMINQQPDAEAVDLSEELKIQPKKSRGLVNLVNKYNKRKRYLDDDEKEGEKKEENKEGGGEDTPAEKNESEPAEDKADEPAAEEGSGDNPEGGASVSEDSLDKRIDRLITRAHSIDDKIDHILFHNGHDLAGVTAHYTPYGIQMLPSSKGPNSVDQKLKMVDYMHNLGGGYNPMLHTMLPYYLGHNEADKKDTSSIKLDTFGAMKLGDGGLLKKVL